MKAVQRSIRPLLLELRPGLALRSRLISARALDRRAKCGETWDGTLQVVWFDTKGHIRCEAFFHPPSFDSYAHPVKRIRSYYAGGSIHTVAALSVLSHGSAEYSFAAAWAFW